MKVGDLIRVAPDDDEIFLIVDTITHQYTLPDEDKRRRDHLLLDMHGRILNGGMLRHAVMVSEYASCMSASGVV
ncbi:hypothetical protein CMI47_19360 [Candidatus Pacearchaeota archaeon]|nr:hypothetical protein [Candidatus Pacearchaeota archaeon]